jgi:hypothetical protein
MFDENGIPKQFGPGFSQGKSVFAPSFMFPMIAIVCFIISISIFVVI